MTFPRPGDVDPEAIVIPSLPEDTAYLGGKLDTLAALLNQLIQGDIEQQNPAPGLVRFFGAVGASASNIVTDVPRWRSTGVLITPAAAVQRITLKIGTATSFVFDFATDDTRYFPFLEQFDSGVEISFASSVPFAAGGFFAYIFGYPETT